ncbi:hypothetical protein [Caryophanon latum]|uniref:Uncharacterized protein n=1 Tax=Caryophanon latum TaxID=33977 RepID=A0A1C0YJB7_9BACL|nr:hypothetical protein [Caryophanon latum]OCS87260.1 hypothetical protein A6K76_02505 [Caryophanon latum]
MKIGMTPFQPIVKPRAKSEPQPAAEAVVPQQLGDAKQALKESVQKQLAEIEAARTDIGEDDPKAQRLIEKFKNGKKLTPDEMAYVRRNAPGMVDYIDRIMRERDVIELSMKMAPSKADVQIVAFRAAKQIEKHEIPEEREIRMKHLADAKAEYEKTDEYKDKPNTPLDREERPKKTRPKQKDKVHVTMNDDRSNKQTLARAQAAYELVGKQNSTPSITHET